MVENFEDETIDLNDEEKKLAEIVLNRFKICYLSEDNCIKQDEIIKRMREKNFRITGPRLRKIFNYLRSKGHPLIATSKGCWYSTKASEIESQIRSLKDRRRALEGPINGLTNMLISIKQQSANV